VSQAVSWKDNREGSAPNLYGDQFQILIRYPFRIFSVPGRLKQLKRNSRLCKVQENVQSSLTALWDPILSVSLHQIWKIASTNIFAKTEGKQAECVRTAVPFEHLPGRTCTPFCQGSMPTGCYIAHGFCTEGDEAWYKKDACARIDQYNGMEKIGGDWGSHAEEGFSGNVETSIANDGMRMCGCGQLTEREGH
jgi:hypothetical protein